MRRPQAELRTERNAIINGIAALQNEGDVLIGVRLDRAAAGGTASNQSLINYSRRHFA